MWRENGEAEVMWRENWEAEVMWRKWAETMMACEAVLKFAASGDVSQLP